MKILQSVILTSLLGASSVHAQTVIFNCDTDTNITNPANGQLLMKENLHRQNVIGVITLNATIDYLSFTVNSQQANYHSGPINVNESKINGNYKYLIKIGKNNEFKFFFEDSKTNVIAMFHNCQKMRDL